MKSDSSQLPEKLIRPAPAASPRAGRRGRWLPNAALSTRLTAIVLVASLPALTLAFWTTRTAREQRTEEVREQTTRLAGLVAAEHRRILDTGRAMLVAVAHLPQVIERQAAPCDAVLAQILDHYQVFANLALADLDGSVVCSARPPAAAEIELADRRYLDEALRTREFTVGEFEVGSISNRSSISFAYPVVGPGGAPQGVVIAALDLSVLALVAEQMLAQLPQGSGFTILDRQGTVIAGKPDGARELGSPLAHRRLFARALASVPGTEREQTADGAVLHAFAPIRSPSHVGEWYTLISIPEEELFGPLGRGFRDSLLMLGLVLVVVLSVGWLVAERLVLRPTSRIIEAARHVAAGNLGVRIGPDYSTGELGELARSFDGMAQALDQSKLELIDDQERLSSMSRRLLAAQENERRRIARELHDELGQLLTGAKLNLVSLQGGLALPVSDFDPLDDTLDLVGRALTTVRELSTELRPAVLDDAGLEEALQWLLDRVAHRAGFESTFEAEPLGDGVPAEVETTLFRVAQEALTNVARHAAANHVEIKLRRRGSMLQLTVRDDGVGFRPDDAHARSLQGGSLGLVGMEERITLAGGRLEIDSMPGRGTTLVASVPVGPIEADWEAEAAS